MHSLFSLALFDQLIQIEISSGQLLDHGGNPLRGLPLRPVHIGEIAGVLPGNRIPDQIALLRHVFHHGGDIFLFQLQLFRSGGAELCPGNKTVAVVFVMPENEGNTGANPVGICILNPQLLGQAVRRCKRCADPVNGKQIGVSLQQLQGVLAEKAIHPHRIFRCDPGCAQQKYELFQTDLPPEFLCDLFRLVQADAADFGKTTRLLFQNTQRALSEAFDDLSRHHRADPLDRAGSQVGKHRAFIFRGAPLRGFRFKLPSVGSVHSPVSVGRDGLSRPRIGESSRHFLFRAVSVGHAQNGIAVFFVTEDDTADRTAEYVNLFLVIRFLLDDSIHSSLLTLHPTVIIFSCLRRRRAEYSAGRRAGRHADLPDSPQIIDSPVQAPVSGTVRYSLLRSGRSLPASRQRPAPRLRHRPRGPDR